ncbi:MAG: hypothetical protein GX633_00370, partial [Clostridiales bacterium]|nr:hypothetical protein [Clostridiales bacterium]
RDGELTLARLIYTNGKYVMHLLRGEAKQPPKWEECGWDAPAPQLPSLEVKLSCPVREFADKVANQHIIVSYGDNYDTIKSLCDILGIEVI